MQFLSAKVGVAVNTIIPCTCRCSFHNQLIFHKLLRSKYSYQSSIATRITSVYDNISNKTMALSSSASTPAALFEGDELWDPSWKEAAGEATLKKRMATTTTTDAKFKLYSSWFCPFAQRAWIAAEESGVDYQWIEINPYYVNPEQPGGYTKKAMTLEEKRQSHPGFVEVSPRGLVPALEHDEDDDDGKIVRLWESLPVAEYIDAVFGGGKLVQRNDPYQVARQQIWCAHCTDRIQKKYYQALISSEDPESQKKIIEEFYNECRSLANAMITTTTTNESSSSSSLENGGGYYFDGDRFSLVDVALAPFWQRMLSVGRDFFGLTFPMEEPEFQRLDKWWKAVSSRPSVANSIVCEPRLVSTYSDYAKNVATSDAARNYFK